MRSGTRSEKKSFSRFQDSRVNCLRKQAGVDSTSYPRAARLQRISTRRRNHPTNSHPADRPDFHHSPHYRHYRRWSSLFYRPDIYIYLTSYTCVCVCIHTHARHIQNLHSVCFQNNNVLISPLLSLSTSVYIIYLYE